MKKSFIIFGQNLVNLTNKNKNMTTKLGQKEYFFPDFDLCKHLLTNKPRKRGISILGRLAQANLDDTNNQSCIRTN